VRRPSGAPVVGWVEPSDHTGRAAASVLDAATNVTLGAKLIDWRGTQKKGPELHSFGPESTSFEEVEETTGVDAQDVPAGAEPALKGLSQRR